jgi:hypothetical protein
LIAEKNSSSALSHNDENVSKFAGQKPVLLDRLRNASYLFLSAAFKNPLHAGAAYMSFATITDLKIV